MPFQKGRKKTGGRTKGGPIKASSRFVDQLQRHGFNFTKAMAIALKEMDTVIEDPKAYDRWLLKYGKLRELLPYMAPKLKEIEPAMYEAEDPEGPKDISTDQLLEAVSKNGKRNPAPKPSPSPVPTVEARSVDVQTPTSTEDDLREVGGEQEPD